MKKFIRIFAIPLSLIIISCFSIGCKTTTNTEQYIGTFNTIFVDQQNTDLSVSFTLVVNEDQTFSLLRRDTSAFIKGTWTSATISGTTQLLCYSNTVTYKNSNWHAYFSLAMSDDGKLLATPATDGDVWAFGTAYNAILGSYKRITLLIFEKAL